MNIKRRYIQIFLDLNKSEKGLLGFTISNRYGLSTTDVISFIIEYKKKGYITCDAEYRIKITDVGRSAIENISKNGIIKEHYNGSDYFNEKRNDSCIAINEPYLPKTDFQYSGKINEKCNKGERNMETRK